MTVKFPKTLGECIDVLYTKRAERLELNKKIDAMKAEEAMFEEHILNTFTKTELNGAKGDLATAGIKKQTVYNIVDWDAALAEIRKTRAWDLLRKQLSSTAVAARFENGKPIAGIEPYIKVSLSLNKAGKASGG